MVSSYKLTDQFLAHNVKSLADLDKSASTFKVTGKGLKDDPITQPNEASRSPSPTSSEDSAWSMPYVDYAEIRDRVIGALIADSDGKFDPEHPSVLFDIPSNMANTYGRHMVEYLCKDLRANFMEFNLDDLDRLGLGFYQQHKAEREGKAEEKKRIAEEKERIEEEKRKIEQEENKKVEEKEAKRKAGEPGEAEANNEEINERLEDSEGNKNQDDENKTDKAEASNVEEDKAGDKEKDEEAGDDGDGGDDDGEPDLTSDGEGYLSKFYFGTPQPNGSYNDTQSNRRNKKALDALLDTSIPNIDVKDEPLKEQCNGRTPLVVYVHGIEKMLDLTKGFRLLSRLRDAIRERRKSGIPIFGVFFWMGKGSSSERKAKKKTGADEILQLPESVTVGRVWKEKEGLLNRGFNLKALKETLQSRYSYLVDETIIGGEVEWELEGMEKPGSVLSHVRMDIDEIDRIVKSIAARSWGKSKIDLNDVSEVLNKMESDRVGKIQNIADKEEIPDLTKDEKALSKYVIAPGQSPVTYDDVIMDPVTKATVKQFVALSRLKVNNSRSSLFSHFKMPGILLFGPPGTGKTHLCRAIANDSGQTFIALSAAELNHCYVGDTEKAISAMFSLARKLHPCILFLDEVDSLFYRRGSNDKSWERSALAQYLQEMDGLAAENSGHKSPLVIVATNRPGDLDEAFLRRLPYRVFLNIPTGEERQQILERMIPSENLADDVSLADIAKRAEGFSGSDLRTLCGQAALSWATELEISTGEAFEGQEIRLSMNNFELAFKRTGPSASPKLIETLENFHKRFQH